MLGIYEQTLRRALEHPRRMLGLTLLTLVITVILFVVVPKGFFPEQDTGRISGSIQASQDISFQSMEKKLLQIIDVIRKDPDVDHVTGFTGGGSGGGSTVNTGRMFIALKPFEKRKATASQVIARLRKKLAQVPGAPTFLQSVQDLRVGGRISSAMYQYTLQGANVTELNLWAGKLLQKLRSVPALADLNSDQQSRGLAADLVIDRPSASRLGIAAAQIDEALYDAFGQRQVSITYTQLNQYHLVMEVAQQFLQQPDTLNDLHVASTSGSLVPLPAFARFKPAATSLAVNHQGLFPSVTISFNLLPGNSLGDAVTAIQKAAREIGLPSGIRGRFAGTAQAFQDSLKSQPLLILAAIVAVYIVLGILYESYIHPLTILSTLPSAGVGAVLALMLFGIDLNLIAIIGVILLIGIVKKNGIMMVDFAIEVQRTEGKSAQEAIFKACMLRFRPIMMTTMAALFGAIPLAAGMGVGSELRRPLGVSIVGGLVFSQMLTLYTTPVVYLYLDRVRVWRENRRRLKTGNKEVPL